jgi:Protein of unknown function (DUF2889)
MPHLNAMEDFRREVSYTLLRREDGTILLTATLNDRFHDISLEVVVDAENLTVGSASVKFRKAPSSHCPNAAIRLEQLTGLVIGRGLNRRIMELLGGGRGCGNLRTLLAGLLPLAMNVKAAAGISDEQELLDTIHNRLVGSCAGYASPLVRNEKGEVTPPAEGREW